MDPTPNKTRLHLISPVHFEKWDWTNSTGEPDDNGDIKGIGGSETNHVEIAWRMARRGYSVTSYSPTPWSGYREWRDVMWTDLENADYTQPGIWIIYRHPETLDNFPPHHPNQIIYFCAQDEGYGTNRLTPERAAKVDWYLCLCEDHARHSAAVCPYIADKIFIWANGLKMELIRDVEAAAHIVDKNGACYRNPRRLMWASSPDRGLLTLLKIFPRVREWVHDAELHVFYGTDNIRKLIDFHPAFAHYQKFVDDLDKLLGQPGVVWHGRVSQPELYREWMKTGIFAAPTMFTETFGISYTEAQALGAIPITKPLWALREYVMHGTFIDGDSVNDPLVQARYVGEIVRLMSNPELQEQIRPQMMQDARHRFNWERAVDSLESLIHGFADFPMPHHQFAFQLKHATGDILNVGCAGDPADLKRRGAVNMDVATEDPIFHRPTKADIIADVRCLPEPVNGTRFDSVVLGDILEHFNPTAVPMILAGAVKCLNPNGRIVITVPDDHRPADQQHAGSDGTEMYAPGVHACHTHRVPEEMVMQWLEDADLAPIVVQPLDYTNFVGHGVVAMRKDEVVSMPRAKGANG